MISNEELWRRAEETEISIEIKRRKWNSIGHTLRKGQDNIERDVLDWNPQGQRKKGGLSRCGGDRSTVRH
jgi:hypothetical protein